ncbi:MAG: hypothetical protein JWQ29_1561 [Phenylobacterium sp.]|nr:hypothetical protein [Phenylobacterium sp.]
MRGEGRAEGDTRSATRRSNQDRGVRAERPLALSAADHALLDLLRQLAEVGYQFTTPAPNTHRRVRLRRGHAKAANLQDVFGWSLPFEGHPVSPRLTELLAAGGALRTQGTLFTSTLGVASVGDQLYLHSALPCRDKAHVFFGPDSYRFVDFLRAELPVLGPGARILDIGAGAGVGGVFAARQARGSRLTLTDVNPEALRLSRINAAFAGLTPELRQCDGLPADDGPFEVVVANPPYIGGTGLIYSDGGGAVGAQLSLNWAASAVKRLSPGGRLLLYSGSAIVRGEDALRTELAGIADQAGCHFRYREIDPDVFPTTLFNPRYWGAERIAAVGAVMVKRP